jgi:hypothetical protein
MADFAEAISEPISCNPETSHEFPTQQWSKTVRSRAKSLAKDVENQYMALGELLYKVYDTPIGGDPKNGPVYKDWGYKSFSDYAEQELGLEKKRAEKLRSIWFHLKVRLSSLSDALRSQLVALGYSKMREIVRVLDLDSAQWWVDRAPLMNYQTVAATVRKVADMRENANIEAEVRRGGDPVAQSNELAGADGEARSESYWSPPEQENLYNKRYVFNAEQLETVKLALERASELTRSKAGGYNLSLICLDFLANNDFSQAKLEQRLRFVAKLEKQLQLRLVAIDPETSEVLYGLSALEALTVEDDSEEFSAHSSHSAYDLIEKEADHA